MASNNRTERQIQHYVDMALGANSHNRADAAHWLALLVARDAAANDASRPATPLVEAYRRLRKDEDDDSV